MAGYNTVCEILTLKKRAIVVPRVRPVKEQWIRAQRLAQHGLVRAIHPKRLTAAGLIAAVDEELARRNVCRHGLYQVDMNGLARIAVSVAELTGAERRPTQYPARVTTR